MKKLQVQSATADEPQGSPDEQDFGSFTFPPAFLQKVRTEVRARKLEEECARSLTLNPQSTGHRCNVLQAPEKKINAHFFLPSKICEFIIIFKKVNLIL